MDKILHKTIQLESRTGIGVIDYLLCHCHEMPSRKAVIKAIKRGDITINGARCNRNSILTNGQEIKVYQKKDRIGKVFPLKLNVHFEDNELAIVEKVPGFPVNGNKYRTIENALLHNISTSDKADALQLPRPVHRLDRATGGLLVIAKTGPALVHLSKQFETRKVIKKYRLIVSGCITGDGKIDVPLDGKEALTCYSCLGNWRSLKNTYLTLVEARIYTGRHHQLRKHFSAIGKPVIGDKLYGDKGNILTGKGLFLWAVSLELEHPVSNDLIRVSIDVPAKFMTFLTREDKRWHKYH